MIIDLVLIKDILIVIIIIIMHLIVVEISLFMIKPEEIISLGLDWDHSLTLLIVAILIYIIINIGK